MKRAALVALLVLASCGRGEGGDAAAPAVKVVDGVAIVVTSTTVTALTADEPRIDGIDLTPTRAGWVGALESDGDVALLEVNGHRALARVGEVALELPPGAPEETCAGAAIGVALAGGGAVDCDFALGELPARTPATARVLTTVPEVEAAAVDYERPVVLAPWLLTAERVTAPGAVGTLPGNDDHRYLAAASLAGVAPTGAGFLGWLAAVGEAVAPLRLVSAGPQPIVPVGSGHDHDGGGGWLPHAPLVAVG